jgi:hypothetical protein
MSNKIKKWATEFDLVKVAQHPVNVMVIAMLKKTRPDSHSDSGEEFIIGLEKLPDANVYTPRRPYGYIMAYTDNGVVFALALGTGVFFRFYESQQWAIENGGKPYPDLGPEWFSIEVKYDKGKTTSKWLQRAFDDAINL